MNQRLIIELNMQTADGPMIAKILRKLADRAEKNDLCGHTILRDDNEHVVGEQLIRSQR